MFLVDRLLMGGLAFVFDKVAQAADAERDDAGALREDLLAAQLRLELGEISEADFDELQADVMARLRELQSQRKQAIGAETLGEVEVRFGGDED